MKKDSTRTCRFTLIELLVAMSVLVILALLLFEILGRGRQAWSAMESNTRVYENARVALDLISRDLQSAIAADEEGREIPFYTGIASGDNDRIAFVAATFRTNSAHSKLAEIRYNLDSGPFAYWLRRSALFDRTGGGDQATWDFYDQGSGDGLGSGSLERVIGGVEQIRFICLDENGNLLSSNDTIYQLPSVVWLSITLFDPRATNLSGAAQTRMIERTRRTFTKLIHLKTQGF